MSDSDIIVIARHTISQFGANALAVLEKRVAEHDGATDPMDLESRLLWQRVTDAVRELKRDAQSRGF